MDFRSEKNLILTVGLPRSGKSTWAKQFTNVCPVINPDSVRLIVTGQSFVATAEDIVWANVGVMVRSLFLYGHRYVILDATNICLEWRKKWFSRDWAVWYKIFNTPVDICVERARAGNDEELVTIIGRMKAVFETASINERDIITEDDDLLKSAMRFKSGSL